MRTCNKENMMKLVTELESGTREQVANMLRTEQGFCCLGVACDLSGVGEWDDQGPSGLYFYTTPSGANGQVLPVEVMNWLGIDTDDNDNETHLSLLSQLILDPDEDAVEGDTETGSNMNDNGFIFEEIAARIRQTYGLGDSDGTDS